LRTLLTKVKGAGSFEALRIVNGVVHDTFKSACIAFGLYDSDDEWNVCLEEAIGMQTGVQLRFLFVTILSLVFQVSRACSRTSTRSTFAMTARQHYNVAV